MFDEQLKQQMIEHLLSTDFYCERHPDEIANFIRLNSSHQFYGLLCPLCLQQSRKDTQQSAFQQQIQPIRFLLKQIKKDSAILINNILLCSFTDYHKGQAMRQLKKTYGKTANSNLQESFNLFFNKIQDMFNGNYFSSFFQAIRALKDKKEEGRKMLQKFIINYSQLLQDIKGESGSNEISNSEAIIASFKEKITQLQILIKHKTSQQDILLFLNTNKRHTAYKFTSKMMGSGINISSDGLSAEMTSQEGESHYIALIQPKIATNKISSIKFRMGKICGWISVGVCWKAKVEDMSYRFQSGSDHGCYHISYDGYSWSDSNKDDNQKYIGWYYNEGDIIEIDVDPQQNSITFKKTGANTLTLIYKKEKKDKMYFGVALNYMEDKVQILP